MKFKIGDRVIVRNWRNLHGTVYKIIEDLEYPIYVLFDGYEEIDEVYTFSAEGVHDIKSSISHKLEFLTPLEKLL